MNLIKECKSKQYFLSLIFSAFFLSSLNAFAVTNQELMDRLDDIESAQQQRELNRLMDEYTRIMTQPQPRVQPPKYPKSYGRYVLINEYPNVARFWIDSESIKKFSNGNVVFTFLTDREKPQNMASGKTWVRNKIISEINCHSNSSINLNHQYFSKNNELVYERGSDSSWTEVPESGIGRKFYSYICNR